MSLLRNQMPAHWRAQWIDPELPHEKDERQPASVLRRRFTLDSTADAVLYITCHGLYEARLNGQRVGDFVLAPGTGDYAKRLTVQAYAVSDLLRQGENEITVTLGDGWYRVPTGNRRRAGPVQRRKLAGQPAGTDEGKRFTTGGEL